MKYIVLKVDDVNRYLDEKALIELSAICTSIDTLRMIEGKKINKYHVVNTDEAYANEVKVIIERHEGEKIRP